MIPPARAARRWLAIGQVAVGAAFAAAFAAHAGWASAAGPHIVGGPVASVAQTPWTVRVRYSSELCTGVIIDATRVLTAAHCVLDDTGGALTPADVTVNAGLSSVSPGADLSGLQQRTVAAITVHPYYSAATHDDDIAILTVPPFDFSGPQVQPISIASATPAVGSTVRLYGWGSQGGSCSTCYDGDLHSLDETLSDPYQCSPQVADPVLLCASSPTGAACRGDSGGGLVTEGATPQLVGLDSFGSYGCEATSQDYYVNLPVPEVRDFVEGSTNPPIAPRQVLDMWGDGGVTVTSIPGKATCSAGSWSGSPGFSFTFYTQQTDGSPGATLQSGTSPTYLEPTPGATLELGCRVTATNGGGIAVAVARYLTSLTGPISPSYFLSSDGFAYEATFYGDQLGGATPPSTEIAVLDRSGRVVRRMPIGVANGQAVLLVAPRHRGRYQVCVLSAATVSLTPGRVCSRFHVTASGTDVMDLQGGGVAPGVRAPRDWQKRSARFRWIVKLSLSDASNAPGMVTWRAPGTTKSIPIRLGNTIRLVSPPLRTGDIAYFTISQAGNTIDTYNVDRVSRQAVGHPTRRRPTSPRTH